MQLTHGNRIGYSSIANMQPGASITMTTYLSLHDVQAFTARTLNTVDHPVVLRVETRVGTVEITLFFETADSARSQTLADVITAAMAIDLPPIPEDGSEAAAYAAAHLAYAEAC